MSIVLGIDPGSRVTGYGLIDMGNGSGSVQPRYIASGCIRMDDTDMAPRLVTIYNSISQLISDYSPDVAAIEQVFVGKSANSALKLGHARGAAMLAISMANLPLEEYAARAVKQAVAGTGAADKEQVQAMVVKLLRLNKAPAADAADALAVALCRAFSNNRYARAL